MATLTFQTPEEAAAWDMYVAASVINHINMSALHARNADDLLLERRKRMAPEKVEREWIAHKPGDPMPCDQYASIYYKHRRGTELGPCLAYQVVWDTSAHEHAQTVAWRPAA